MVVNVGIVLKSDGGECIMKRNAKQAMKIVLEVSVPAPEMLDHRNPFL